MARADPVLLRIAGAAVVAGSLVGVRSTVVDVDEVVFRSTIEHMQDGAGYYGAFEQSLVAKSGVPPSQVRSVRTPVVAVLLSPFPAWSWRLLAVVPAMALCLAAAALAGPDLLAQRLAAALAGLWMITSLPLLYLHAELWGAPLVLGAALALRRAWEGRAAALCALATATRELYGLGLLVGLATRGRRGTWVAALVATLLAGAVHVALARRILVADGFDPPEAAHDRVTRYLGLEPGLTGEVLGVVLLLLAVVGFVRARHDPAMRFLGVTSLPLVVGTALAGRAYWTIAWCGATSAAAAVALVTGAELAGWRRAEGAIAGGPYPRE